MKQLTVGLLLVLVILLILPQYRDRINVSEINVNSVVDFFSGSDSAYAQEAAAQMEELGSVGETQAEFPANDPFVKVVNEGDPLPSPWPNWGVTVTFASGNPDVNVPSGFRKQTGTEEAGPWVAVDDGVHCAQVAFGKTTDGEWYSYIYFYQDSTRYWSNFFDPSEGSFDGPAN